MQKLIISLFLLSCFPVLNAQKMDFPGPDPGFQIGIGFGQIPSRGGLKPSLTVGYHFDDRFYVGVVYQFKDQIRPDERSFNVQSSGLDGIVSSRKTVGQRMMVHTRFTLVRQGPYLSFGLVHNGQNEENMQFDARERVIDGEAYTGTIGIRQIRSAGWGPALGIGYQYTFRNGLALNAEWTPAWFARSKEPTYRFFGTAGLNPETRTFLSDKMTDRFQASLTNRYQIFHLGPAYRFR